MKSSVLIVSHFVLFLVFVGVFFAGPVLGLFHMDPFGSPHWFVSHPTQTSIRYFVPTGLFLMTVLFVVVLGVEAVTKALRSVGVWTAVAFGLALVVGWVSQFGFVTSSLY